MFISGFTIVRDGTRFGYPFEASIRSLLPLVDELIVAVGDCEDGTWETVAQIGDPRIQPFRTHWDVSAPGARVLSHQTNLALQRCRGPWAVYLQADEVLHEESIEPLRAALADHLERDTEGLLFDYLHFHGSYEWVGADWRSWYPRAFRVVKTGLGVESLGDAAGFGVRRNGRLRGLIGAHSGIPIYHYGWCRPPPLMEEKQANLRRLYGGKSPMGTANEGRRPGSVFDQRRGHLKRFSGTHPSAMAPTIAASTWTYEPGSIQAAPGVVSVAAGLLGPRRRRVARFFVPQWLKNAWLRLLDRWRHLMPASDSRQ